MKTSTERTHILFVSVIRSNDKSSKMCAPMCSAHLPHLRSSTARCPNVWLVLFSLLYCCCLKPIKTYKYNNKHMQCVRFCVWVSECVWVGFQTNWFQMVRLYDLRQTNNYFSTWHSVLNIALFIFQLGHTASEYRIDRYTWFSLHLFPISLFHSFMRHYFFSLCVSASLSFNGSPSVARAHTVAFRWIAFLFFSFSFNFIFVDGCVFDSNVQIKHSVGVYISHLIVFVFVIDWLISIIDASTRFAIVFDREKGNVCARVRCANVQFFFSF